MILSFDRKHLQRIVAATQAAASFNPTYQQLYDPKLRKDGRNPGFDERATVDDLDPSKLKSGLWLVADHGVYLRSNAKVDLPAGERRDVAYALEADPQKVPFEEWWDVRTRIFGGDDGVEYLPLDTIAAWVANSRSKLACRDLQPDRIVYL